MRKKRILTEEHKRKISESHLGKKKVFSANAIENIRRAAEKRRGKKTKPCPEWVKKKISEATKGIKKKITKPNSGWFAKGHIPNHTQETLEKIRKKLIGRKLSPEQIEKIAIKLRGKTKSDSGRINIRNGLIKRWEKTPVIENRRNRKHKAWCSSVKERDGNKCTICGNTEHLHVHHIKTWKEHPELRYELSNGITYCWSCHNKEEWKNRKRIPWNKGIPTSEEERKRLINMARGRIPWNKGKKFPGNTNSGSFNKGKTPWNKKFNSNLEN